MAGSELIARGVFLHDRCVLVCRSIEGGYAYLPGGHVEFGESAADALAREMMEETGLRTRVGACLSVDEHVFTQRARQRHEINIIFLARIIGARAGDGPLEVGSLESQIEFEWVSISALRRLDLRPTHHREVVLRAARSARARATRFISRIARSKRV